jgi:hypothetical protein
MLNEANEHNNWIIEAQDENLNNWKLYVESLEFVLAAMTTVGFGDVHATHWTERIAILVLVVTGTLYY